MIVSCGKWEIRCFILGIRVKNSDSGRNRKRQPTAVTIVICATGIRKRGHTCIGGCAIAPSGILRWEYRGPRKKARLVLTLLLKLPVHRSESELVILANHMCRGGPSNCNDPPYFDIKKSYDNVTNVSVVFRQMVVGLDAASERNNPDLSPSFFGC